MTVPRSHITFLELFPIVLAIQMWGEQLKNQKVIFHCDNQSVVEIMQKQSTKDASCMRLVRHLVLSCLQHNILLRARHIPGLNNCIADVLSRLQLAQFHNLCPKADPIMTPIPPSA